MTEPATSVELCKELYELSNWSGDLDLKYKDKWHKYPDYKLGYLFRKLPRKIEAFEDIYYLGGGPQAGSDKWTWYYLNHKHYALAAGEGGTPEDALAQLAIELFKKGLLKKES